MKNSCLLYILIGFFLLQFSAEIYSQDKDIEEIILSNDAVALNQWLNNHDINGIYSSRKYTPLIYSVVFNRSDIVKKLIELGANLEISCETKSPLFFALEYNRTSIARLLIRKGANVKARDSLYNTALFYAASFDNIPIMRLLIRKGVPIEVKNKLKITARHYAILCNKQKAANYLKFYFERHLPNYVDGPYVYLKRKNIRISYLLHDSIKYQSDVVNHRERLKSNIISFKGILSDTNSYILNTNFQIESDFYPFNSPIFVMGDVHGDYDGFVELLQKGNVIDEKLNWKWGTGHLVLLGDIVDRGDKVTECLWLIYKLEQQARKKGGFVHYLLGNHEIMIMTRDHRYLADKYFYMNDQLRMDFSMHFDQNSFFGKWLSSKNSIIRIGPYLFVHAGLSYESFQRQYSITDMNSAVRKYLKNQNAKTFSDTIDWVIGDSGPLWYRGYNAHHDSLSAIKPFQLDSVLNLYNAKTILVGHTHTPGIQRVYRGKVILMDVPYYLDEAELEAVIIDSKKIRLFNAKTLAETELK